MVIKTTSTAYDNDGNVIASYDNEKEFNSEDVEDVVKRFKRKHEQERKNDTPEMSKENDCPCDEPCCCEEDGAFDDEDGVDVVSIDISFDTLKKAALIAGGLIGFKVLRKVAKVVL